MSAVELTDAERWGIFIEKMAETLGVPEEFGGGWAEERILHAIAGLIHTAQMNRLTFELILANPEQSGALALEGLKRSDKRAA